MNSIHIERPTIRERKLMESNPLNSSSAVGLVRSTDRAPLRQRSESVFSRGAHSGRQLCSAILPGWTGR
jgi:hypothetical protein